MANTIVSDYEERTAVLLEHTLRIVCYRLGDKFVCCIDNFDPGVAICRTTGASREQALAKALAEATGHLRCHRYMTVTSPVIPDVRLTRIVMTDGEVETIFEVAEFLGLPMQHRMDFVLSGCLKYLDAHGNMLPAGEAMRMLKRASDQAYAA